MPGPSLGTNLFALVDWSTAFPFIDLFKMSRPWYTQTDASFNTNQAGMLKLDSEGWIQSFTKSGNPAPFERVSTILFTDGHVPGGVYVLDWEGQGSVDVGLISDSQIISRGDHKIVFRLKAGQELQVSVNSTDPNDNGNYIRDIRLYNQQDAALLEAGKTFAPEFLEKIEGFRALRFMNWMETNNSDVSDWSDRRPGGYARETSYEADGRGASVETMVALANETNADPWFTIPHKATDDYIRKFATYVKNHLEEGRVARFEFSNEVWNGMFEQSQYAHRRAVALWGASDDGPGRMEWYGMRAARMAQIVANVFGDETGERALNVFSTQAGSEGLERYALNAPSYVAAGGTAPKLAPFHVYAIAPYFGGTMGTPGHDAMVNRWIAAGEAGFKRAINYIRNGDGADSLVNIGETVAYHAAVAKRLGWQLEAYEGGQHVVDWEALSTGIANPAQTAFFVKLVRRPEFQQLYKEYFNIWKENGGGLMAHFTDFGVGDKYGSWGIWNSAYAADSPRAKAIEAFRDNVQAWWDDDRTAASFENGITRVDRKGRDQMFGTDHEDALVALAGDDRMHGRGGADYLNGGLDRDTIYGGTGADAILGLLDNDLLDGGEGADLMRGGEGNDRMFGRAGSELMFGGNGADTLHGGQGADRLFGSAGADRFVFDFVDQSPVGSGDRIGDFQRGVDKIDLSDLVAGEIAWLATAEFTGTGQAEARIFQAENDSDLVLRIDRNGDGTADLSILLTGLSTLGRADLIL